MAANAVEESVDFPAQHRLCCVSFKYPGWEPREVELRLRKFVDGLAGEDRPCVVAYVDHMLCDDGATVGTFGTVVACFLEGKHPFLGGDAAFWEKLIQQPAEYREELRLRVWSQEDEKEDKKMPVELFLWCEAPRLLIVEKPERLVFGTFTVEQFKGMQKSHRYGLFWKKGLPFVSSEGEG
jgi:hypothetical protein